MWLKTHTKEYKDVRSVNIWSVLTDINNWPLWHEDLESCHLEGTFELGRCFTLKPKGMGPVTIKITELEEGRAFTDCTTFFGAKMYDTHQVEETPQGIRVTNTVLVEGPLTWLWMVLVARKVASSAPEEMDALVQRARTL